MGSKKIVYDVEHSGEYGAGIRGFTDKVTIEIESGDPGGDESGEDSFQEYMLISLKEWYDGAEVTLLAKRRDDDEATQRT